VLLDGGEAERFVELLRKVVERDGMTVFAWCVMSNHYNLAVRTGSVTLGRPMKSLHQRFTHQYNARKGFFGPLWQGRYRAKLIDDQRYFDQLLVYIHLNPVAAGLVCDPYEYRWSGHREILGRPRAPIVDVDEVLQLFGGMRQSARAGYVRTPKGAVSQEWIGEAPGKLPWWRLGRPPAK
jgi:putative transposase